MTERKPVCFCWYIYSRCPELTCCQACRKRKNDRDNAVVV